MESLRPISIRNYAYSQQDKIKINHYAEFYNGINTKTNQKVRIKIIKKQTFQKYPQFFEITNLEVRTLNALNNSRYFMKLLDSFVEKEDTFLIFNYYEGETLKERINGKKGPLSEDLAKFLLTQIFEGYKELERLEIIHRSIHTKNFFLVGDNLLFGDLGFVAKKEKPQGYYGVLEYMAPELIMKREYNHKVDFWSIGIVYYEMLFGKKPFCEKKAKELLGKINAAFTLPSDIPLNSILSELLKIDPKKRNIPNLEVDTLKKRVIGFFTHKINILKVLDKTLEKLEKFPTKKLGIVIPRFFLRKKVLNERKNLLNMINENSNRIPGVLPEDYLQLNGIYTSESFLNNTKAKIVDEMSFYEQNYNDCLILTKNAIETLVNPTNDELLFDQDLLDLLNSDMDEKFLANYPGHILNLHEIYKFEALSPNVTEDIKKNKLITAYLLLVCRRIDHFKEYEGPGSIFDLDGTMERIEKMSIEELQSNINQIK